MKHIRLYLIALFVACSVFMVCPFAFADSMPGFASSPLDEYLSQHNFPSNFQTYYTEAKNNAQYYLAYRVNNFYYLVISPYEYTFEPRSSSSAWYPKGKSFTGTFNSSFGSQYFGATVNTTGFIGYSYSFTWASNGNSICVYKYSLTGKTGSTTYNGKTVYSCYGSQQTLYDASYSTTSNQTTSDIICYGNMWIDTSGSLKAQTTTIPQYTEDDRLKLYKLWSSQNGDSLVVDLSAFRSYTPAAVYEFSNIVLTLTCNGVDTDYNLPLTSSTINNGWDNNSNLYTISTPVSDFTLSDTYDTYITKVSFSLDVSSPGGSGSNLFYISANFPLDVHHSSITPGAVPTPVYDNPTVKTPQDLVSLASDMSLKSTHNLNGTFVVHSSYTLPEWADSYIFELNRYSDNSDSNYAGRYIDGNPNDSSTRYVEFDDIVYPIIETYDNVYDVFVFPIHSWYAGTSIPSTIDDLGITGYLIFYTDRYFQRQETLSDVDILTVLQTDANNFVDFVEYMQVRLDDFESKSLEILNPLYDETTYIDDKLASILYAVNSIENYNDSSIVSLLTDIKNLLSSPENEIDTPQECIQLYEAHPNYFNELWGTPTPALRSASVTPSANNPYISSDYVRADLVPAWWEGKTLTMIYILKNDGETSRFYNDILNGLFDSYENLIESDNSFNTYIDSLFKTGYDYTSSFYGHLFDLDYNPEAWDGGFVSNE